MNIEELFRSQFGPESARELAQELKLDQETAARLLDRIVRLQLETLAQQAKSDTGRAQILEAIGRLPRFRDVPHALTEQGGASSLQVAGEILSPSLLGGDQLDLAGQLSRVEGVPQATIVQLMNMALPLLLSFIGQAGVNAGSITQIMSTIRASGVRPRSAGGSYVSRAAAATATSNAPQFVDEKVEGNQAQAGETKKSAESAPAVAQPAQPAPESTAAAAAPAPESPKPQPQAAAQGAAQPAPEPELAQDTDYSKDSVVSALLKDAEVPEPGAAASAPQPQAPAAPAKENPYRNETSAAASTPAPEPELAQDTDYSKSSVVSALLKDAEVPAAPQTTQPAAPQQAEPTAAAAPKAPAATPAAPTPAKVEAAAPQAPQAQATQPQPAATQAAPAAGSPEALAAAAAAAGVGAGAVRGATPQPPQAPAGSPWKSAKPVVIGARPSQAGSSAQPAQAAGPRAVPVTTPAAASAALAASQAQSGTTNSGLSADSLLGFFREQFSADGVGGLAEATGFTQRDAGRAVQGTAAVLLAALSQKGRDEAGAADILKLSDDFGRVAEAGRLNTTLLGNRGELGAMEVRGLSVLDRVLDNPSQVGGRLGTALGTSGEQAGRLLALLTPFVLGLLGSRARAAGTDAAGLSRALGGLNAGKLESLLPEGLGVLKSLLGMPLFGAPAKERATLLETKQAKAGAAAAATVAATPTVTEKVVVDEKPAAPVRAPEPERHLTAAPASPERKGGFPWWLLLLPLLAGLAWYFSQDRAEPLPAPTTSSATTSETTTSTTTTSSAAAAESSVASAPGTETSSAAVADEAVSAAVTSEAATDASAAAAAGTFAVTSPAAGETVPDTGFTMSGTGTPDTTYQLLEDGVSVGTFVSETDGTWEADVAAPAAGDHVYSVQDDAGTEVLSVPVTVEATEAAAACSEPLTLSLNDGETVSAPFRFGGVGNASGYQVRVLRGSEEIGAVDITLAPNCTWNYLSQPGGEAGTTDAITYEVRSLDDLGGAPLQTINLNVVQAGE